MNAFWFPIDVGGQFDQRVPIGWSANDEFGSDITRCTGLVLDDD
jgi:hypothetical protein